MQLPDSAQECYRTANDKKDREAQQYDLAPARSIARDDLLNGQNYQQYGEQA
ncbi:MAG: hypothetical protein WCE61_19275 [Candidatus Acidiferrum sp.]